MSTKTSVANSKWSGIFFSFSGIKEVIQRYKWFKVLVNKSSFLKCRISL